MNENQDMELIFKQGDRTLTVVLKDEAIKEVEDIREKLGMDSIVEAILYSVKLLALGVKELDAGEQKEKVKLPNGKEIDFEIKIT